MYVCEAHTCLVLKDNKTALDPLKLELGMILRHHVDADKGNQVLCNSS